ncbi:MAG: DUF3592 domain-containing protein [Sinobacteraceae bacterium]|nr:DUF3592 domain-containing protein [Nevskiaceae bacterium]MCP5338662.1 DUF3592 domain-containing protein [Nevskiaceae bacterium]MCP5466659.1 DUF3592 domain-containing protein [Nevskiaceae bacterium]
MAVVSGLLGLWLLRATHALADDALRVEGQVIAQRESPQGQGRSMFTPRVAFVAADGSRHEFSGQLSSSMPRFPLGTTVPVIYRRADPARARIDLFVDNWLGPSLALGLTLAMTLAGLVLMRSGRAAGAPTAPPR